MKELSIIIVNYNTKDLLKKCLLSIDKFLPKVSYEVIVVDNGSTDGSVEMLTEHRSPNTVHLLIKNRQNLGFAKANNQGIKKAKGRYVLLLNSDTEVKKRTLDKLIEFAKKTKSAGVVGARLLNPDGTVQPSVYRFPTLWRAIRQYWLGQKNLLDKYVPYTDHRTPITKHHAVEAVVGAVFLITPQAREKIGLLDERYFMYFEDLDYCRRVKRAGLSVYYLVDSEIIHHHGKSGKPAETNKYLIDSSKIYHGLLEYYSITFVLWSGQKTRKPFF